MKVKQRLRWRANPSLINLVCVFLLLPSCDADPSALAKYVVALVKKDKSEKELKALCIDQLDVFLQKGTRYRYKIGTRNGDACMVVPKQILGPRREAPTSTLTQFIYL